MENAGNGGGIVYKEIESKREKGENNLQEESDSDQGNSNRKNNKGKEKFLKEKDQIIATNKIEKQKLLERIMELENDLGKKTVKNKKK